MAATRTWIACLLLAVALGGCAKAVKQATKVDQSVSRSLYRINENLRKRIQDDQQVIDGDRKTWKENNTASTQRVYCYKTLGELDCYNQELPGAKERLVYTGDEPTWDSGSSGAEWQTSTAPSAAAPSLKPMETGANWTVSNGGREVSAGQYQKFKQDATGSGTEAPKHFPQVEETAPATKKTVDASPGKPRELIAKP